MNHPSDDALLLLAYGELEDAEREAATAHLAACVLCGRRFDALERARVAADWALARPPRRRLRWATLGALSAAAVVTAVLVRARAEPPRPLAVAVPRYAVAALAPIDSILTRLEQEKPHAIP